MTLTQAQEKVDQWIKTHGVRYFNELTNLAILFEEVGELSRHFARIYGEQSYRIQEESIESKTKLREEMADVLFVLLCLANQTEINLEEALLQNLDKKTQRDKNRHKNNPKINT